MTWLAVKLIAKTENKEIIAKMAFNFPYPSGDNFLARNINTTKLMTDCAISDTNKYDQFLMSFDIIYYPK